MSDVHIKSKNQSGGITAQNVNTMNETQISPTTATEKAPRVKSVLWWVATIAGLLVACITIYKFFGS